MLSQMSEFIRAHPRASQSTHFFSSTSQRISVIPPKQGNKKKREKLGAENTSLTKFLDDDKRGNGKEGKW